MSTLSATAPAVATWNVDGIHLVDTAPGLDDALGCSPATDPAGSPSGQLDWSDLDPGAEDAPGVLPILLCLHGIGSSSRAFIDQMADLADEHRLVAWDAPGYGHSADPEEALDLGGYVERILRIIDCLGGKVHLLGVSFGGVLALASALADPRRVASAILIGASRGSGRSASSAAAMLERVDQLERLGPAAFAQQRAPRLLSPDAPAALVRRVADTMAEAVRVPGYRWAAQTMATTDLTARLADVDVPTMVLYGEDDKVTGRPEGEVLAHGIPGAVSVSIVHAGHLANQEQPTAVNAWIASFVQIVERLPAASIPAGRRPRPHINTST